jgi:tetratricopeptide (TPR) repeat protein
MTIGKGVFALVIGLVAYGGPEGPPSGRTDFVLEAAAHAGQANVDLLLEQGKRLFDAFNYDEAVPIFDRLITELAAGGQSRPDVLAQAYAMRAQSKFGLGDMNATEQDFAALLKIQPDYKFPGTVSARLTKLFDSVKAKVVGQLALTISHPGEIQIDGKTYTIPAEAHILDLPVGDHELTVKRSGFTPVAQRFTVRPAEPVMVELKLERVSANLEVRTTPGDVEVLIDGKSRGRTPRSTGTEPSAPLLVPDVPLGARRLELRRDCYVSLQTSIEIRPEDMRPAPLSLDRAVANVRVQSPDPGALVLVDGAERGKGSLDLEICEGTHAIEVRGANGRYVDRREWKAGNKATLTATLRRAFPIVVVRTPQGVPADQVRTSVERAMAPATGVLVYSPPDVELQPALKGTSMPPDFLASVAQAGAAQVSVEGTREVGRKLSSALGVQGIAGVSPGADAYTFVVSLLAAGSGLPDVITINTADATTSRRSLEGLSVPLPPIVRPSIDTVAVDLAGVKGATVVRVWGASEKAGLAVGDMIVSAGGTAVASVADLRAAVLTAKPGASLALEVAGANARTVTVPVSNSVDTIPLRDPAVMYNLALIQLQEAARTANTPVERTAAQMNLAIVHLRLRNWDQAISALDSAALPSGAGVSSGTVLYLTGLAHEGAGRTADAQAAFKKAAVVAGARLSTDGPLVAPLAQQKLRSAR